MNEKKVIDIGPGGKLYEKITKLRKPSRQILLLPGLRRCPNEPILGFESLVHSVNAMSINASNYRPAAQNAGSSLCG